MSQIFSSNLLLYLSFMAVGMILGRKGIVESFHHRLEQVQMLCLIFLLFVMGMRLGMDDAIIQALGVIGLKGVSFGIAATVGSVLFVYLYDRLILQRSHAAKTQKEGHAK